MGLLEILGIIKAALEFPREVRALVDLLRKTPEERRQEVAAKIEHEAARLALDGRPSWD